MTVVVFGSLNIDLVGHVPRFPGPGETVLGSRLEIRPGGKGANQATVCAGLGHATAMVGRVGDDGFGRTMVEALHDLGADTTGIATHAGPSGAALIELADSGENAIVVLPGANGSVGERDVAAVDALLAGGGTLLLMQLELPLPAVASAATAAGRRGVPVVLDPAPAQPLPAGLLTGVDVLTPNAGELGALVGSPVEGPREAAAAAARLHEHGCRTIVVTLGGDGALISQSGQEPEHLPALEVPKVSDTVGAGDAFTAALAVALAEGRPLREAAGWGLAAGAIAVSRPRGSALAIHRDGVLERLARPDR